MVNILDGVLDELQGLADAGLDDLANVISAKASKAGDPVATFLLNRIAAAVEEHGADAIAVARVQFEALLDGKHLNPVEVRKLPLHERGPLIAAALQREIDMRDLANGMLVDASASLAQLLKGLVKGAFS